MTARWLSFSWSSEHQVIACDGEQFAHPLSTNTSPSHDIAHLLAAASGLPWKPAGRRDEICFAEFNAVFIEHLVSNVYDAVVLKRGHFEDPLDHAVQHSKWFAEVHYSPFPVGADEALERVRQHLRIRTVTRLSPIIFRMRIFELQNPRFRTGSFAARFSSMFKPEADEAMTELQRALEQSLHSFARNTLTRRKYSIYNENQQGE